MSQPKTDPSDKSNDASNNGERTLALLQRIQNGSVDPKGIGPAERRQLVVYLMADGYSTADIAQILRVSDRSIERDKKKIREQNALVREPALVGQMVGRLYSEAELTSQRIRKVTRDKRVSASVKVDAEHRCYQIFSDLVQRLQSLGYLPIASQKIQADLTHRVGEVPDFVEIHSELQRLKLITAEDGGSVEAVDQIAEVERKAIRADLAAQVVQLSEQVDKEDGNNEQTE